MIIKYKKVFIYAAAILLITNILAILFIFKNQRKADKKSNRETSLKIELSELKQNIQSIDTSSFDSSLKMYWINALTEIPKIDSTLLSEKLSIKEIELVEKDIDELKLVTNKLIVN